MSKPAEPLKRPAPVFKRVETGPVSDAYNLLLALPLWALIGAVFGLFLAANLVFAFLFLLDPGRAADLRDFEDAFFLSVQTIANVNLGFGAPASLYAKWLMTAEAFVGLLALALGTGLFFARISRPTARVMFSRTAVITDFDGKPTLMFRAGNRRGNQLLDAQLQINIARNIVTPDGHVLRRFDEITPVKSRSPLFAYAWMIMHQIDAASPLAGATAESLEAGEAEILVILSGVDDRFGQPVYARCSYTPDEIIFGRRLADVVGKDATGRWRVDFRRFHDLAEPGP